MKHDLLDALVASTNAPGTSLAPAALTVARIEYPHLDPEAYLTRLDRMGDTAADVIAEHTASTGDRSTLGCVRAVNRYLFDELGFTGNRDRYEDPRNSCLNQVLDKRTGIPITLSVVYIEVARRAGVHTDGEIGRAHV